MSRSDTSGVVIPPPVYFAFFLALAFAAERFYPAALLSFRWSVQVGYGVVGLSFLWLWLIEREFKRHRTSSSCSRSSSTLIASGPYRFSRNPAYLGFALMIAGFSLVTNSIWMLAAILPACTSVFWFVIRKEEAYLIRTFGDEYAAYRRRVRRWL